MFTRWRLPRDNFPDDTETRAFQDYHQDTAKTKGKNLRRRFWLIGIFSVFMVGLVAGSLLALVLLGDEAEDNGQSPPVFVTASPVLAFPSAETPMMIPARIDNTLAAGEEHRYAFFAESEWTWTIQIDSELPATLNVTHADGTPLNTSEIIAQSPQQIQLQFEEDGVYSLSLQWDNATTDGSYNLSIMPVE
jgi:hypothetical protein